MINPYIFSTFDPSHPVFIIEYLSKLYSNYKTKKILIVTDNMFVSHEKNTDVINLNDNIHKKIKNFNTIVIFSDIFKKIHDFIVNNINYLKKNSRLILSYNLNDKSIDIKTIENFINSTKTKFNIFSIKKNKKINNILFKFIKYIPTTEINEKYKSDDYQSKLTNIINNLKKNIIHYDLYHMQYIINIGQTYNYSINNYYLDYINNYTLRLRKDIYSSSKSIYILYRGELKLNNYDFHIHDEHKIKYFNNIYNEFIKKKKLRKLLLIQNNVDENNFLKLKINRKHLPKYLFKTFLHKYVKKPLNNAFIKLFEIFNDINILKIKKTYTTLHLAELPGGFIYATNAMINKITNGTGTHKWYGNSYNPKIIGEGFDDGYGLVRKYPNRWLWGSDGTGDITKVKNIEDIKKNMDGSFLDLITLDGGLSSESGVFLMQKLDYAQMLVVAMLSSTGTNCVVKTFGNYLYTNEKSIDSIGLYVDIILIYSAMFKDIYLVKPPNSSLNSMEFYIVGIEFIPLDFKLLEKLKNYMENFGMNKSFLHKKNERIEEIMINMYKFYDILIKLNNEELDKQNIIYSFENINSNSPFYYKDFVHDTYGFMNSNENLYKIGLEKAKLWCKTYNFNNNINITI